MPLILWRLELLLSIQSLLQCLTNTGSKIRVISKQLQDGIIFLLILLTRFECLVEYVLFFLYLLLWLVILNWEFYLFTALFSWSQQEIVFQRSRLFIFLSARSFLLAPSFPLVQANLTAEQLILGPRTFNIIFRIVLLKV